MTSRDIDAIYDGFCAQLPPDLRAGGRELAALLGLAPSGAVPWSDVFQHAVTLQAPALFAGALGVAEHPLMRKAVAAHMLAVIEAFGTDRLADGQIEAAPTIARLLAHLTAYRNVCLLELGGPRALDAAARADRTTREAIATERRLLSRGRPVSMGAYLAVSSGKQAVGFTATLELGRALGATHAELEEVRATLIGVSLGLQVHDDVVDWQEDAKRGGAWALLLASGRPTCRTPATNMDEAHALVQSSCVLADMLHEAAKQFERARDGANALGLKDLEVWSEGRAEAARAARTDELRSPGYLERARALGPWARAVLG